jgi:hypothetical protein
LQKSLAQSTTTKLTNRAGWITYFCFGSWFGGSFWSHLLLELRGFFGCGFLRVAAAALRGGAAITNGRISVVGHLRHATDLTSCAMSILCASPTTAISTRPPTALRRFFCICCTTKAHKSIIVFDAVLLKQEKKEHPTKQRKGAKEIYFHQKILALVSWPGRIGKTLPSARKRTDHSPTNKRRARQRCGKRDFAV